MVICTCINWKFITFFLNLDVRWNANFRNRGAIRLTVSKYYLPSGKSISEVGVVPDIKVEEKGDEFSINTTTDNQLNYAIDLFIG